MSNSEEHDDAKTEAGTQKRAPAKKRATTKTKSAAGDTNKPQPEAPAGTESGRVAMSAAQRRLEEMGMIDSGEQKSSATVPSAWGFRIMVLAALALFVVAVFFIRANSHRSTAADTTAQVEQQPQNDLSLAAADASAESPTDSSTPPEDAAGTAPSEVQAPAPMSPPPGMMDGRGGMIMGYGQQGMQPPPMGGAMMPHAIAPANPDSMQPYPPGPAFQNGQPMQPMMGYGYGPYGPYYWFIVPIPQMPGSGQPAYPGTAVPNGYDVPTQPAYDMSPEPEQMDTDAEEEDERTY